MSSIDQLPDRITRRLTVEGDCLVWTGSRNAKGYGNVWWNGRVKLVHRVIFAETVAPIPDGLVICHACDNPPCVKPTHLFLGTYEANIVDAIRKGRVIRRDGCKVDGCTGEHLGRGWCGLHYQRWVSTGDPTALDPASSPARASRPTCARGHRFNETNTKVRSNGTRECRACGRERARARRAAA